MQFTRPSIIYSLAYLRINLVFCEISKLSSPEHLHCKFSNNWFCDISKFASSFMLQFRYESCLKSSMPVKSETPALERSKESIFEIFDVINGIAGIMGLLLGWSFFDIFDNITC